MRVNEAIQGIIIILFSIFIIVAARSYPALPGVPYGPGLFPTVVAACMLLGGLILIFKGLRNLSETGWGMLEPWAKSPRTYITLGLIFSTLLFYILFSEKLGFVTTSVLIIFALLLWTRGRGRLISSLIVAVAFSLVIYFVFVKIMRVPLPAGLLQGVL